MKVITEGRAQKGWAKEFVCTGEGNGGGGCAAVLLVEFNDLYITHRYCYNEHDTFTTFRCVACGVETDIKHYTGPSVTRGRS
ncbi:hypothetical protein HYV70_01725 [Candidatus Uhrbacteria bacterium]|nr:hypothetical protein [Candidatus Uhrbacteria bacterium]